MSKPLTTREKRLLWLCLGVLVLMATAIGANVIIQKRAGLVKRIAEMDALKRENEAWLRDQAFWEKRRLWLADNMPRTDSMGRAQGQLLEELQNEALEREVKILQQTPLESVSSENYREVAVSLRLTGDLPKVMAWLATMQSPEKFQTLKVLELDLDRRSRLPTPQAQCDLTIARWFKPETAL
jgi:hypothetical protein